ncbi:MAG: bifunctional glutamate N-acetyltransferase/amino-acid acetyltransferase ArgJ [Actinomycetota bacterium]
MTRWVEGMSSSGVAAGIKPSGDLDLGLLVAGRPVKWAGTFTRNAAAAACVDWNRAALGRPARALVVNSGNANACTGSAGRKTVESTAAAAATLIGCEVDEVLVCSTGPIGVPLDVRLIETALPAAARSLGAEVDDFSRSLMTTDTFPKVSTSSSGGASVTGVAKGAAMIAPNMATMLAFLGTDADVSNDALQAAVDWAVDRSFNRLCLDGCESTNDSVLVLATGNGPELGQRELRAGLLEVCSDLALKMARDTEGATKLVRIRVEGARSETHAAELGRAVARSDLWRAAAHGADPNWGRVLAAMGAVDRELEVGTTSVAIGDALLFGKGEPCGFLPTAAAAMSGDEFTVSVALDQGDAVAEVLTADLSEEYVTLNAEVTT